MYPLVTGNLMPHELIKEVRKQKILRKNIVIYLEKRLCDVTSDDHVMDTSNETLFNANSFDVSYLEVICSMLL